MKSVYFYNMVDQCMTRPICAQTVHKLYNFETVLDNRVVVSVSRRINVSSRSRLDENCQRLGLVSVSDG